MLMFSAAALALAAVAADAQVLRISPAVIGSTSVGSQQVIQLGAGGSRPIAIARQPVVFAARPVVAHRAVIRPLATQVIRPVASRLIAVQPQPIVISRPLALTSAVAVDETPKPYAFAFDSTDEFGARHAREETADGSGAVRGSYTIHDSATGLQRVVTYVADADGFRAEVNTNEPGTQTSAPAAATYTSSAQ